MAGVSNFQIYLSHFLNMLPVGVIFCVFGTLVMTLTATPIIPQTSAFLIMIFLILHFMNVMCMAYCSNFLITNSKCCLN